MASTKQPIELVKAKGRSHMTKAQIEMRERTEIKANSDNIQVPTYLPKKLKDKFNYYVQELKKINLISNLDSDALARYIVSEYQFQEVTKQCLKASSDKYYDYLKMQDKLFNMARKSASDLGLTISSRCKLVVPEPRELPENKFSKFF